MPKNVSADKLRVPLNCLIAPVTKTAITGLQNETKESQGEIVDRAIALLAFGEEIKSETFIEKAKRTMNHPPRFEPQPPMVTLDAVGPKVSYDQGKASAENWRAGRGPLLKPSEREK